jgi:hypothetical protein
VDDLVSRLSRRDFGLIPLGGFASTPEEEAFRKWAVDHKDAWRAVYNTGAVSINAPCPFLANVEWMEGASGWMEMFPPRRFHREITHSAWFLLIPSKPMVLSQKVTYVY